MIQEVFSAELPVGEKLLIKKNVIKNGNSGKRICIVTGTHGDELEGQYVAFLLNSILSRSDALAHLDGKGDTVKQTDGGFVFAVLLVWIAFAPYSDVVHGRYCYDGRFCLRHIEFLVFFFEIKRHDIIP